MNSTHFPDFCYNVFQIWLTTWFWRQNEHKQQKHHQKHLLHTADRFYPALALFVRGLHDRRLSERHPLHLRPQTQQHTCQNIVYRGQPLPLRKATGRPVAFLKGLFRPSAPMKCIKNEYFPANMQYFNGVYLSCFSLYSLYLISERIWMHEYAVFMHPG